MKNSFIPIPISDKAIKEVRIIMNSKEVPDDYGLRIGVRSTGCRSSSPTLGFDKKKETDLEFLKNEVPVYIEKKDVMFLVGYKLDFVEIEDSSGFTFNKKNDKEQ